MFYFLHRVIKWVFIALIAAGLYWVWLQREFLDPVYAWYDVYNNGGIQKSDSLDVVHGKVVHVLDGHTFQMTEGNRTYNVRLTGFEIPVPPLPDEERDREVQRRNILRQTILQQRADVRVTYAEQGSILGIVTVNGTNLNMLYLTNGLSKFRPDYIKPLPRDQQYQFFAARRLHEKQLEKKNAFALQAKTPE